MAQHPDVAWAFVEVVRELGPRYTRKALVHVAGCVRPGCLCWEFLPALRQVAAESDVAIPRRLRVHSAPGT